MCGGGEEDDHWHNLEYRSRGEELEILSVFPMYGVSSWIRLFLWNYKFVSLIRSFSRSSGCKPNNRSISNEVSKAFVQQTILEQLLGAKMTQNEFCNFVWHPE